MSELLEQVQALESEFLALATADELDDERLGGLLQRRDSMHHAIGTAIEADPQLLVHYQPFLRQAYKNTQQLQQRCEHEREDVKQKLLKINQGKKAHKAY